MAVCSQRCGSSLFVLLTPSLPIYRHLTALTTWPNHLLTRYLHTMTRLNSELDSSKSELLVFAMKKKIFCEGSLLDAVQRANLFADCKHFVDMPLKHDAETTLVRWEALRAAGPVSVERLREFIEEYFDQPEDELVGCDPVDWNPDNNAFNSIKDSNYRSFALALHRKWPTLYRKISDNVQMKPERYSIIPVPNPFVVPGGRFVAPSVVRTFSRFIDFSVKEMVF
ncbi:hypothetical protein KIN20_035299 [Parelaphostrongylus tenuis]|uniref:Trehalase n=1 Tax=Parelaphostrongylus tenuis TaxID=148309 RepID=A0AAD5WKB9_PARTN|nr:hypothetical protein KIN20_035299 [Parelaphostrongylus tenuis]